jgi:hypothetical protein
MNRHHPLLRFALLAILIPSTSVGAAASQASTCTPEWSPTFGAFPGVGASIWASTVHDDGSGRGPSLYIGGSFFEAGGQPASRIARWDRDGYAPLGAGLSDIARALLDFDDGTGPALIAAGDFTLAGGVAASRVARWDGQNWTPLGAGLGNLRVYCLAEFDDGSGPALYAGGSFAAAGGGAAPGVAKWNGQGWSAFDSGLGGFAVRALAEFDDGSGSALYAAGYLSVAGSSQQGRVARWNGSSWVAVGAPLGSGEVLSLVSFDDGSGGGPRLHAAGHHGVARWSGLQWSNFGAGSVASVESMCVFDDGAGAELHIGGQFLSAGGAPASRVARWNGQAWSALGAGLIGGGGWDAPAGARTLTVFDDGSGPGLFVGGVFDGAGGVHAKHLARWRGAQWSQVGDGLFADVVALAAFDDGSGSGARLFAGGYFSTPYGGLPHWLAVSDGGSWRAAGGGFNGGVAALLAFDDGSAFGSALYAGGAFSTAGGVPAQRVARWNGQAWSAVGSGLPAFVHSFTSFDDGGGPALYAGCEPSPNPASGRVWKWNGQSWSTLGAQMNGAVRAVLAYDDGSGSGPSLYAAGIFTNVGGAPANFFARWDGQAWTAVGAGLDGPVNCMEVFDEPGAGGPVLYVGGEFTAAGGAPAAGIAKWDGQVWAPVGSGVNGAVLSMREFSDGSSSHPALFVGGGFTLAGGAAAQRMAKWDGQAWSSLGFGASFDVAALTEFVAAPGTPGALVAGGWGGYLSGTYLAKWQGCAPQGSWTSYCTAATTSIGCVPSIGASGSPSVAATSGFTIDVADVEGLKQGLVLYGISGRENLAWAAGSTSFLCVRPPSQRMGVLSSGGSLGQCDGSFRVDWLAYLAASGGGLGAPFSAGEIVNAQAWFRDPPAPKGSNLSDALEFVLAP